MADIFNSTNNLYWVFTSYAKQRLASLSADDKLFLYKAGIGGYDWYTDELNYLGGYSESAFKRYFEDTVEKNLGQPIPDGKLAINSKSLEEKVDASGNVTSQVVILSVTVPETLGGVDIREIAIYETIDDVDHLFAICTMQPLPKPTTETNHFLAIQFNARFESRNLASAYEQIVLDPNNNFATVEEINTFEENLLFVETNLAEQISNNSRIIGYNRPQQLYEEISTNKKKYSSFAVSTTYANTLNIATLDEIKSFWIFRPNNDTTSSVSISDLSFYGNNLSTDKLVTLYESGYEGLSPWINFSYDEKSNSGNYYMLNSDIEFDLLDEDKKDTKLTLFFVGAQNSNQHDCTIMAKDNSKQNNDVNPSFCIKITKDREVKIRLYKDRANYVEYTTGVNSVPEAGVFYVLSITYDPVMNTTDNILIPRFKVLLNGKELSGVISRTGNYQGMGETTLPLTSRLHTLNDYDSYVDSKVCLISLIKKELSTDYIRAMTYNMMALIGVDPCLVQ